MLKQVPLTSPLVQKLARISGFVLLREPERNTSQVSFQQTQGLFLQSSQIRPVESKATCKNCRL